MRMQKYAAFTVLLQNAREGLFCGARILIQVSVLTATTTATLGHAEPL
jgi:hypothetical protein